MSRSSSSLADRRRVAPDEELARSAAAGDRDAFEELYRRHAQSAWRVAQAVTANPDDAADAVAEAFTRVFQALPGSPLAQGQPFRPYLLAATRNIAIDGLRKGGRHRPVAVAQQPDVASTAAGPSESLLAQMDASLVSSAFRNLPERWRSVLWLTEVEGMKPQDAAPILGLSANGTAQLAVRARAGLKERYLQAHVGTQIPRSCQHTVERLGAYVGGALSARETSKVDQHLAGCEPCQKRLAELRDVGRSLRLAALPLPLGLATMAAGRWKLAGHVGAIASRAPSTAAQMLKAERPLQVASGLLLALGIIGAAVVSPTNEPPGTRRRPLPPAQALAVDQVAGTVFFQDQQGSAAPARSDAGTGSIGADPAGPSDAGGTDERGDDGTHGDPPPTTLPPPPPPVPLAQATLSVNAGPAQLVASAGGGEGSCTGASANGTGAGCQAEGADGTATLTTGGSLVGDHTVAI